MGAAVEEVMGFGSNGVGDCPFDFPSFFSLLEKDLSGWVDYIVVAVVG